MKIKSTLIPYTIIILGLIVLLLGGVMVVRNKYTVHKNKTISVLFVGNSLTYVNDLPKTLSDIATSLGDKVEYDSSSFGGYTLMQHSQNIDTKNKIVSKNWDYVVLQEQSEFSAMSDEKVAKQMLPFARSLNDLIKLNKHSKTVFFETWAHKNGDLELCKDNPTLCSYDDMQDQVNKSYTEITKETGGLLAPVGEAWRSVLKEYPEIPLFQTDNEHPSIQGTYLSACVFYITLFHRSVTNASPLTLNPEEAQILKSIAQQTVLGQ